jgi:GNAT superfamily N-acetyltransferase
MTVADESDGAPGEPVPEIRRAGPGDVDRIVLFNQAMARETEGRELDRGILRDGVERLLEDPRRGVYWVAELDGEVAAQLLVTTEWSDWRNAEVWWIQSVYVSREHRREGLYRALHATVRRAAREAGAAGLRLYVDRDNVPAQETYASLGMRRSNYRMYEEMWK